MMSGLLCYNIYKATRKEKENNSAVYIININTNIQNKISTYEMQNYIKGIKYILTKSSYSRKAISFNI